MGVEEELEDIEGICPSCNTQSTFKYRGLQERLRGSPLILYNCENESCRSTLNLTSIIDYNRELAKEL